MAAGETTVGGIVGFLRLDDDQFNRAVDAAIARIRLLDGQDVDIDVDVDTHNADRDLDRVDEAMRRVTRSNDRMGRSFQRGIGPRAKLILTAIGAGFTLLGPAAGAATAAILGFSGAVGVGVLAWKGFKEEIKDGTDLGVRLKSQIDGLKASIVDLSDTSANAMGPGLLAGLQKVADFLPTLDGSVSVIARDLGDAFNIGADGIINGLRVAMPLLEDGGVYAREMAQAFADFTQSQDFKDFIDYARQELPEVLDDLGKLTKGLIDMAVALEPVGEGILHAFGAIGEGMSKMSDATGKTIDVVKTVGKFLSDHAGPDGPWNQQKVAVDNSTTSLQAVDAAITAASNAAAASAIDVGNMSTAYGATAAALDAAVAAQQRQADSAAAATLQMQLENDAAGLLKQALDELNGEAIDAASAQNRFDSSLANMGTHVDKTGKKIHFTTSSINNMSAASVALRGQLIAQVNNAQAVIEANGGLTDSTGQVTEQAKKLRKQIIDNAVAHGVDRKAAQDFIDTIFKFPKKVPPTKLDVEKKAAEEKLAALKAHLLDTARNYTATVTVQTIGTGRYSGKKVPMATGGPVPMVPGARKGMDSVPAVLMPEEYVIRADGSNLVDALHYFGAKGYAKGGAVGGPANAQIIASLGKDLGAQVVQAFADGMSGGKGSVKSVAEQIRSIVSDSAKKAADDLKSLLDEQASYAKQVGGQFASLGSLTADPAEGGKSFTVGMDGVMRENTAQVAFVGSLQSAIAQTQDFKSTIQRLVKLGARTDVLQQFLDKGPESAAAAKALAAMGRSGIADVNRLQSQLVSSSSSLGSFGASAVFAPRIAAARSQVADAKVLEVAVSRATAAQVAELRKVTAEGRKTNAQLQRLAAEIATALQRAGSGVQNASRNAPRR